MKEIELIEYELLKIVFDNFKESTDCNGLASYNLNIDATDESLVAAIVNLICADKISLLASEHDGNPHIIRFGFPSKDEQIAFLNENGFNKYFCLYPSSSYLSNNIETDLIPKFPFQYMMKTGTAQFKACYFEWGVLYKYFSDPRYKFSFSDYIGRIESSDDVPPKSSINLRTFGIGKDENGNRVVVAFPRDLNNMSSACQIEWYSKMVPNQEQCMILESYKQNLFGGYWAFPQTVYRSLIQEMVNVNQLTYAIWDANFFREEFDQNKPVDFDMIYIPTYKVYMDYVSLLEKIVVSNINDSFFDAIDWSRYDEDGKIKGSLVCLKEFLQKVNPNIENEITSPLRKVRRLRQNPAHKIEDNSYGIHFLNQQHELTESVFNSINMLRRLFQTHPKAKGIDVKYANPEGYIIP